MSRETSASRRARPRRMLWVGAAVGMALSALSCGTQANGPTTVPQAPPAPLEPVITGRFVDEDSAGSPAPADAGVHVDAQPPADAATAPPPSPDGSVLVAPDVSGQ
ncbi:MAG: hypothetical protein JW940_00455 [Polyangiaceae bacterium]|nr:hypothetical protein [Polyangiaceae bacterium]